MTAPPTDHPSLDPYRVLIFDWDGTLMDSVAAIVECMEQTLVALEMPPVPARAIRQTIGLGLHDTLDALVPESGPKERQRILETYRDLWIGTYRHRSIPFPGVEETLGELGELGYLLAVATGKHRIGLDRDFQATGLARFFQYTRTADEAHPKPDPRMVEDILGKLEAKPGQALVVGDTTHDLLMARAAGVGGVAVESGSHGRDELEKAHPLVCLPSVHHLRSWLGSLGGRPAS